jgi:hypothetical protein
MSEQVHEQSKARCNCGTPLDEVEHVPGTENCIACHELLLMQATGHGIVRRGLLLCR